MRVNSLADKLTEISLRQLQTSWNFKQPRIFTIRKYRRLYNGQVEPRLRSQFNVPIPVFAGMIDTLQADLNDKLIVKYGDEDISDWKAVQKLNVAIKQESSDARPDANWNDKLSQARQECIMTGRGIIKFISGNISGNYYSKIENVPFEDFFFEPSGGGDLDNHLFHGQQNIWRTETELLEGVKDGIYDKKQVDSLLINGGPGGSDWKMSGKWDGTIDFGNRFKPLGLNIEGNNYVGERVFNFCEWILTYENKKWYIFFEAYTGTWIRFSKLTEINSSGYSPFMSFASHKDSKNFASKSFTDDLYPIADSIITLFNQDLTNRQKRNLNAKAFDKDMFKDVAKLDEAQYRPDALVPADTKDGQRRISEGIYAFQTPEITGTIDLISWLEQDTGKNLGVSELQQGVAQGASKRVGVTYAEISQISKRLSYMSEPFVNIGKQLGLRFLGSLKDHMTEPMALKMYGEYGVEFDVLRRIDLNFKRNLSVSVTSQSAQDSSNAVQIAKKEKAFNLTANSQNINSKVRDEMIFRDIGEFSDYDIALLMDVSSNSDKETQSEVASAIQQIVMRGKLPPKNWNADQYFLRRILDFAKKHKDTLPAKKYDMLIQYADMHMQIAADNASNMAVNDVREENELMQNNIPINQRQL